MRRTKLEKTFSFYDEDNACLSLMAESMAKHRSLPKIRIFSAGIRPGKIPPEVRRVLQEIGVEQSGSTTKSMDQIPANDIDLVVSFETPMNSAALCPAKPRWKSGRFQTRCGLRAKVPLFSPPIAAAETKSTKESQPCSWTTGAIWCRSR